MSRGKKKPSKPVRSRLDNSLISPEMQAAINEGATSIAEAIDNYVYEQVKAPACDDMTLKA